MKVLIVGAGMAGLALGALFGRRGVKPGIIDSAPEWKTIGYVLAVAPNGMRIMRRLGVADELERLGARIPGVVLKDAHGKTLNRWALKEIERRYGHTLEIERDLL